MMISEIIVRHILTFNVVYKDEDWSSLPYLDPHPLESVRNPIVAVFIDTVAMIEVKSSEMRLEFRLFAIQDKLYVSLIEFYASLN